MAPIIALGCLCCLRLLGDLRLNATALIIFLGLWSAAVLLFVPTSRSVVRLFGWAILLRGVALVLEPTLSDDIYRYIWEGHLINQGRNPYWEIPIHSDIVHWSKSHINHPDLTSIYPPGAQFLFAGLAWVSDTVWSFSLFSTLCDLGILWILYRRFGVCVGVWIYALHPLPIIENAGSGHMESWAIFALMLAVLYPNIRSWMLWIGGCIKLLPGVLLLASLRSWRDGLMMVILVVALLRAFSLYAIPNGALQYAQHWSFHGSVFPVVASVFASPRIVIAGLWIGAVIYLVGWVRPFSRQAFWLTGLFVLLSPTVHPWYLLWVFPLAIWHKNRAWLGLCSLYPLWYVVLTTWDSQTQSWDPPMWPQWLSYGGFVMLLVLDWRATRLSGEPANTCRERETFDEDAVL